MKRLFKLLLILIVLLPTIAFASDINLYSKAYILYDSKDDKVLVSKDIDKKYSIASLTKIMTVLVAVENIKDVNEVVTVKQSDLLAVPMDAYRLGLKKDEQLTYEDLIYGTLLSSAGDAATVLAINTGGSLDNFVRMMNNKANEIGLKSTHYSEVIGLDDKNNYSTIEDLLKLFRYAMQNETFATYFKTKHALTKSDRELTQSYITFSEKVGIPTPNLVGAKTGYTDGAGLCIAFIANKNERYYYGIALGAPVENLKYYKNIQDASSMLKYIDDNYEYRLIISTEDVYNKITVKNSDIESYEVKPSDDVYILFGPEDDRNKIMSKTDFPSYLSPKNKKGDKIGTITYYYNGIPVATVDAYLDRDIKFSLIGFIKSNKILSLIIGLVILIILSISAMLIIKKNKSK